MTDPKLIEEVAWVIAEHRNDHRHKYGSSPQPEEIAVAVLAHLEAKHALVGDGRVSMPAEPGPCMNDSDGHIMVFMSALHAHIPEDERPNSWSAFSDEQRARIRAAYRAMITASSTDTTRTGETETAVGE